MADQTLHPAASSRHLPSFITTPGEADILMVIGAAILLFFFFLGGLLYFRLHALPDRFAVNRTQYEIVCVLSLLGLVTQKYIFWISALLLALIKLPDFRNDPVTRVARSLEKGVKDYDRRRPP